MRRLSASLFLVSLTLAVGALLVVRAAEGGGDESSQYVDDVRFAIDELETRCGDLLELKKVRWKKATKSFPKEAREVRTAEGHFLILTRLLARLQDGKARLTRGSKATSFPIPSALRQPSRLPGFFLCEVGKKVYVKAAWSEIRELGLVPGVEILRLGGVRAQKCLDACVERLSDTRGFSTPHHARYLACLWGLMDESGTRLDVEYKDLRGKRRKCTVVYGQMGSRIVGPAFFPEGTRRHRDLTFGRTAAGWGYIALGQLGENLPEQLDEALGELSDVPGLILDFRCDGVGGVNNDALMGRFIPRGQEMEFGKRYESLGESPYGGPIVVIVDGAVGGGREVSCGIFKEHGRAYMIGESPTMGTCSETEQIELPSKMLDLIVSVRSKESRFNDGKGIEGIGVVPHEIVPYDPEDLARGVDTLTARAEALLAEFPQEKVPYKPALMGWSPPGR